jgi:hypothetical protein
MAKAKKKTPAPPKIELLMSHYLKGVEDMDIRRTRKKGWNDIIDAYMGKMPKDWPYQSVVSDPRIRTTILEKTARLLNAKLQGRLVPREGGDIVKAKINNAILDFQWDSATKGGSMIEKIALSDMFARVFGAAFVYVYWDAEKDCNELKVIDPRDIFIDFSADHIRNAKWVQIREFTTIKQLKERGFELPDIDYTSRDLRSTSYESIVKQNRGLEDRTGQDLSHPTIEVVTEWTPKTECVFLPKHNLVLRERKNPYNHGKIPVEQLRYYPIGDDVYGESEVEPVLPLQKAINAVLCGFLDSVNISMRPPVKIVANQARVETIEYGPGAQWIIDQQGAVQEATVNQQAISSFNSTYPALIAAFNSAMGDQSLGTSNITGKFTDKTATEVQSLERQQNNRDQYNQLYLTEFLKGTMLMWLSNNQQYLFDDETKHYRVFKIIGKDNIRDFQNMQLDDHEVPDEAMQQIQQLIMDQPLPDEELTKLFMELSVPKHPVITNPNDSADQYDIKPKLQMVRDGHEADLYVTKDDMAGVYDYIPDVHSMAAGAGQQQERARQQAFQFALNPQVQQNLQAQGERLNMKELLITVMEYAGERDPEGLFESIQQPGSESPDAGAGAGGAAQLGGVPELSASMAPQPIEQGLPQSAEGLQYGPQVQ